MATLLVLTGITGRDDLAAEWGRPGFQRPDYVVASFGDLMGISAAARAAA